MHCEQCREAISARLDGEDLPGESAAVDAHLAGCAACRAFSDDAARVTRLARTSVVGPEPDLLAGLLAALDRENGTETATDSATGPATGPAPGTETGLAPDRGAATGENRDGEPLVDPVAVPRPRRAVEVVRGALAALAVGQLGLAVSGIVAATGGAHLSMGHHGMELMGATATHFSHESAAWNLALGVAFGWVALRGRTAAPALVPVIGAFVGVLTLLSIPDLLADRVDAARLVGHGLVALGLVLLLAHRALTRGDGDGGRAGTEPATVWGDRDGPTAPATPLRRRFGGGEGLEPTGRRAA